MPKTWADTAARRGNQSNKFQYVTGPVIARIVSSGDMPFAIGFPQGVSEEALSVLKKIKSPSDGWTFWCNWDRQRKVWSHCFFYDHLAFCTLEAFLNSTEFVALWNDASIVSQWSFHRDSMHGEQITEAEAVAINKTFKAEPPSPNVPSTEQAPRRRSMPEPSASSAGPSGAKKGKETLERAVSGAGEGERGKGAEKVYP